MVMSQKQTIRVGMIGCGGNARGHMTRLKQIKGVEIVALSDPSDQALEATFKAHPELKGLPTFSDYRDMLEQVEMDAVEISTPHALHYDQIMDALDAGKHVLCEKPMVCTTEQALLVVEKVHSSGLVMGISYQRHFMGPYRYCRERILSGEAGKVNFISAWQSQNWYRSQVPRHTWRSRKALSCGGQLNDSGSHLLDIVLWMTSLQPVSVYAVQNNLDAEVDILTAMSVEFDNGAVGNFESCWVLPNTRPSVVDSKMELVFTKGSVSIDAQQTMIQKATESSYTVPGTLFVDIYGTPVGFVMEAIRHFVKCVEEDREPWASGEDGLEVVRTCAAIVRSAETGRPVEL